MAPGASIYVFECPNYFNDLLSTMVGYTFIKQFSSSWNGEIYDPNPAGDFLLMEMAAQGQSFFVSSGDLDSYDYNVSAPSWPQDSPYATVVGGTELTMNGSGASYASETVVNLYPGFASEGSGGGVSVYYAIPYWQQGLSMTANQGSTTQRNVPDVAMVAYDVDAYIDGSRTRGGGGTGNLGATLGGLLGARQTSKPRSWTIPVPVSLTRRFMRLARGQATHLTPRLFTTLLQATTSTETRTSIRRSPVTTSASVGARPPSA